MDIDNITKNRIGEKIVTADLKNDRIRWSNFTKTLCYNGKRQEFSTFLLLTAFINIMDLHVIKGVVHNIRFFRF